MSKLVVAFQGVSICISFIIAAADVAVVTALTEVCT